MNEAATRRYRPSRYSGRLAILVADGEPPHGPIDERLAMREYADGPVVVASVPGTHATVCDGSHIGTIAGVLRDLLDDAEGN
jgi:thioesterase domain-containing protein